jgi:predicted dehydrogenase
MLKVAIVGCGKIADAHAMQIEQLKECEIVGVCDREPLMASQLCERFQIKRCFTDVAELVRETRPDVVHITTPPASHFEIARFCLESGCHVYVEKPFTLYASEAHRLIELAKEKHLKLTVGHNYQFSHVARRARALVAGGYLGGTPIHMESYYSYDLGDSSYARSLLADKQHWVRRLPGQLLHNIISHGIARIAEFLSSSDPQVFAYGFVSPMLKSLGETAMRDELRVVIAEDERTTAYFTFSSQMKPRVHEFRIFGPKNGLVLDQNHETLLRLRGSKFKSYADQFIPPVLFAKQHIENLLRNGRLFLNRDFHMDSGMKHLIESFYRSIREDGPVPIPYREILLTARIMDTIFDQLRGQLRNRLSAGQSRGDLAFQAQPLALEMAVPPVEP